MFYIAVLVSLIDPTFVTDFESMRFRYVAEQRYDTSCGLSAVCTLMRTSWGVAANEDELALDFVASRSDSRDFTVSLADLRGLLTARGFTTAAYKMTYSQLEKAVAKYAPVLVHYDKPEGHFALALWADEKDVITADPSDGVLAVGKTDFGRRWSGYVLLAALPKTESKSGELAAAVDQAVARVRLLDTTADVIETGLWP